MVKIYFKTFGCPTNFSESEVMMGILEKSDFKIAESPENAFVIVLNICTVKGNATALREIRSFVEKYPNKKFIIAGCITGDIVPKIREITGEASLIGTHNIKEIVQVVEETINDNPVEVLIPPVEPSIKIGIPRVRKNPSVAIIPIGSGCSGNCAYCSVKVVKGELVSYPMETILEEARKAKARGARQIWITAQDTASYMLESQSKTKLPELIREIIKIPGEFKIRMGMMNINNLIPVIDEMVEVMNSGKVFKFLHLPLQSGSDKILKSMGRKYTAREFQKAVEKLRENIPKLTISTDIICGFPGEDGEDFLKSVRMVEEINPDILNVSKFRPRPGTPAAEMEGQVDGETAKERSKKITSAFEWKVYRKNKDWLGWTGDIIIEEDGKEGTGTFIGRNSSYKPVIVTGKFKLGELVKVKIDAYTKHDLRGLLV